MALTNQPITYLKKDGNVTYPVTHSDAIIGGMGSKCYNINDAVYSNNWNNVVKNGRHYSSDYINSLNKPSAALFEKVDTDVTMIDVSRLSNGYIIQEVVDVNTLLANTTTQTAMGTNPLKITRIGTFNPTTPNTVTWNPWFADNKESIFSKVYVEDASTTITARRVTVKGLTSISQLTNKLLYITANKVGGLSGTLTISNGSVDLPVAQLRLASTTGWKTALFSNWVIVGQTYAVVYDGTYFNIIGVSGSSGHTIQDTAGVTYTQRPNLRIVGTRVTVTDNAATESTVVNVGAISDFEQVYVETSSSNVLRQITINNAYALTDLTNVLIPIQSKYDAASQSTVQIRINAGGSPLVTANLRTTDATGAWTTTIPANWVRANQIYLVMYDGTNFVLVSSGSGGGHLILNGNGTQMPSRAKLQFEGTYTDVSDLGPDTTVVSNRPLTDAVTVFNETSSSATARAATTSGTISTTDVLNRIIYIRSAVASSGTTATTLALKIDADENTITGNIRSQDINGNWVTTLPTGWTKANQVYGVRWNGTYFELISMGGGGGGHIIENTAGTDMTQRAYLMFNSPAFQIADDSVNNRTRVDFTGIYSSDNTIIDYRTLTSAEFAALNPATVQDKTVINVIGETDEATALIYVETSSSATARTISIPDVGSYTELLGRIIYIQSKASATSTSATLNISGLGAKTIRGPLDASTALSATLHPYWVNIDQVYAVVYDGTYFNLMTQNGIDIATTAEAQAGTNAYKGMTPLRVADVTGILTNLGTSDKTSLVASINEINSNTFRKNVVPQWVYDLTVANNAAKDQVVVTESMLKSDGTTTTQATNIPIASDTQTGVMSKIDHIQLTTNTQNIASLLNGGVFIGQSFATKAALNAYTTPSWVKANDFTYVIDDETHGDHTTQYIYNGTTWNYAMIINYDIPSPFTNTTAGLITGIPTGTAQLGDIVGYGNGKGYAFGLSKSGSVDRFLSEAGTYQTPISGHAITNSANAVFQNRKKLRFTGLPITITDDTTNAQTIVDVDAVISSDDSVVDMITLTSSEFDGLDVSTIPEGTIINVLNGGTDSSSPYYAETGDSTATTRKITMDGVTSYSELVGRLLKIKSNTDGTAALTSINVNGLGAKSVAFVNVTTGDFDATVATDYWTLAGQVYEVYYDGTSFNLSYKNEALSGSYVGTCTTAAGTQTKAVTIAMNYALPVPFIVNFTNDNTATNPKLSLNGNIGDILYKGSVIPANKLTKGYYEFFRTSDGNYNIVGYANVDIDPLLLNNVYTETSSSATVRTVTIAGITNLTSIKNIPIGIYTEVSNTASTVTLNVNGLGAVNLAYYNVSAGSMNTTIPVGTIVSGIVYNVYYNGSFFVIDSIPSQYDLATVAQVKAGGMNNVLVTPQSLAGLTGLLATSTVAGNTIIDITNTLNTNITTLSGNTVSESNLPTAVSNVVQGTSNATGYSLSVTKTDTNTGVGTPTTINIPVLSSTVASLITPTYKTQIDTDHTNLVNFLAAPTTYINTASNTALGTIKGELDGPTTQGKIYMLPNGTAQVNGFAKMAYYATIGANTFRVNDTTTAGTYLLSNSIFSNLADDNIITVTFTTTATVANQKIKITDGASTTYTLNLQDKNGVVVANTPANITKRLLIDITGNIAREI